MAKLGKQLKKLLNFGFLFKHSVFAKHIGQYMVIPITIKHNMF